MKQIRLRSPGRPVKEGKAKASTAAWVVYIRLTPKLKAQVDEKMKDMRCVRYADFFRIVTEDAVAK